MTLEEKAGVEEEDRINLDGISIKVLFPGEGTGHPTIGDVVKVHYKAFLMDEEGLL